MSADQSSEADTHQGTYLKIPNPEILINNLSLGICIGATTISMVQAEVLPTGRVEIRKNISINHKGNPKALLIKRLPEFLNGPMPVVLTGRKFRKLVNLTSITEPEATECALELYSDYGNFAALASLGAETFVVYELNNENKIRKLIAKNQCASGTGEFFMQQIGRMNLGIEEAVTISTNTEPFKVSGRCSVFCKSDCTHALNKGIPKEQVASGLALMIAQKVEELLQKSKAGRFMMVGGVTHNKTVMEFLRKKFHNLFIPNESIFFEALGAAVFGFYNRVSLYDPSADIFTQTDSLFTFHKPLKEFQKYVKFTPVHDLIADLKGNGNGFDKNLVGNNGNPFKTNIIFETECILGLDVGSTTTKGVVISTSDCKIIAHAYLNTHGNPIGAARDVYRSLEQQINKPIRITGLGITGSGRHLTALHAETRSIVNEITAHANASVFFDSDVDTIFEIGGQDAKYTFINQKVPSDYAMNEACSAGTGSFIQEAALESLNVSMEEIESIAFRSLQPLNFRDQCAALIGADIKTALQENFSHEDVLAGLVYSICINYINRVKGNRPIGKKIFMQGGVCYNRAIPVAMAAITGKEIIIPPLPGLMGAFGAALKVKEWLENDIVKPSDFTLKKLIEKEFLTGKTFTCKDKLNQCDRKCTINTYSVDGKTFAFGGACNKYYDSLTMVDKRWQNNDFVAKRQEIIFSDNSNNLVPENFRTIGINRSFTIHRLHPLYHQFFTSLGFQVILPEIVDPAGLDKQYSSFCFPGELAHGLFSDLLSKKPDYIFMPQIYEMHVEGCEKDQKDSCATCVFVSKEDGYLSQAFQKELSQTRFIHPYLNFAKGYQSQRQAFINIGHQLGITSKKRISEAFAQAVTVQQNIEIQFKKLGAETLQRIESNPDEIAFVIVGREYNAFDRLANKGIPQKLASLGYSVIPYDFLESSNEEISEYQSWEAGKRILRAAHKIQKHPQLFAVYITNFSCGPDSFLVPSFRRIMGIKPSLTLELDQHTADAGINTRIDAFIDVIKNYRKLKPTFQENGSPFHEARITNYGKKAVYVDSGGEMLDLKDKRVKFVVPCMGDMVSALFAASLRSLGYNAVAMPEMDHEILVTGQHLSTGKECLPIILLAGSLMHFVKNNRSEGEKLAFMNIGGTSACRIAQYPGFLTNIVKDNKIPDVAMFTLISQEGYLGLSEGFLKRSMDAIVLNDVLEDVRSGILANAADPSAGIEIFYQEFEKLVDVISGDYDQRYVALNKFSETISKKILCKISVSESRYIALTGEIFIRHNQFAHKKLNHYFGKRGYILKDAYISEWIKYLDYAWRKGVDRPAFSIRETISRLIREQYIGYVEGKVQQILALSGYLKPHKTRVVEVIKHSLHVLPLESTGEPALTLGTALAEGYQKYCGIINIGPFGCLQTRIGEAVCTPVMTLGNKKKVKSNMGIKYNIPSHLSEETEIPFLTIECDGKGFPQIIESQLEAFLVQVERAGDNMTNKRKPLVL